LLRCEVLQRSLSQSGGRCGTMMLENAMSAPGHA
jgi:hypothetical protein